MSVFIRLSKEKQNNLNKCICRTNEDLHIYSKAEDGFLWIWIACDCGNKSGPIKDEKLNIPAVMDKAFKQWNKEN